MKNIYFVVLVLISIVFLLRSVMKSKIAVKESFFWFVGALIALILSIFPNSIATIAEFFGVSYAPSLLFVISIVFILFMQFRDSKRSAYQQSQIIKLSQEIAILKQKNKDTN